MAGTAKYDFGGWATRNDIQCYDGKTIKKDAFLANNGQKVPLVWNHQHNDPSNVIGHAILENRDDGVYAFCSLNDTVAGVQAKGLVQHGDIVALSIYANQIKQKGDCVLHGAIREVSLVIAGANPGAFIDNIMAHGEASDDEATIYNDYGVMVIVHSEDEPDVPPTAKQEEPPVAEELKDAPTVKEEPKDEPLAHSQEPPKEDETLADVFNTLTDKQKTVVYAMIDQATDLPADLDNKQKNEGDDVTMKHNAFNKEGSTEDGVIKHSMEDIIGAIKDAKRCGSMKDSFIAHSITNIDYLFPDATSVDSTPQFISRDTAWAQLLMGAVKHTPFSRIKSIFADITEDDARALGYIKGKLKKEEVFSLLKRTTSPTTVYKKQKIDRDDVIDITDFDVIVWLKLEMRMMLEEEIARQVLVGDGRLASSDDKINNDNIRPIWTDADLFTIKEEVSLTATTTADERAKAFIRTAVKSRKKYKGSGSPTLFTTEDMLTDCLLMEDTTQRIIYDSVDKLAIALRVKNIVTVPVMEDLTRVVDSKTRTLMGIIVNLMDYTIGADKGGAVNLFDDFDIDFNAQKYLIETRCSGALTKPYSAIAIESIVVAG